VLGNVNTVYHKGLQKKRRKEKATETNYSGFRRLKMPRTITYTSLLGKIEASLAGTKL
jgi:hypothetical protein